MDALFDPDQLRASEAVEFHDETTVVESTDFGDYEALDSHAVVGLTNDRGEVLLQNDGSHGWTLPAFRVSSGDDWVSVAQEGIDSLTGGRIELDTPELVRRVEYRTEGDQTTMYTVVFRAVPVEGQPIADRFREENSAGIAVNWAESIPTEQEDPVAADIRRFLD